MLLHCWFWFLWCLEAILSPFCIVIVDYSKIQWFVLGFKLKLLESWPMLATFGFVNSFIAVHLLLPNTQQSFQFHSWLIVVNSLGGTLLFVLVMVKSKFKVLRWFYTDHEFAIHRLGHHRFERVFNCYCLAMGLPLGCEPYYYSSYWHHRLLRNPWSSGCLRYSLTVCVCIHAGPCHFHPLHSLHPRTLLNTFFA